MSLFDRWFGRSPPPAPESRSVTGKEPRRNEPAGKPPALTALPPLPTIQVPHPLVLPQGYRAFTYAMPLSLEPSNKLLNGGVCVAFMGQGGDELVEDLEGILRGLEPWLKDPPRHTLLSQEQALAHLGGPSPSTSTIPRLLLWMFNKHALWAWLKEPASLQALLHRLYQLKNSAQPPTQCVYLEHDCEPGGAVMARLLLGLGLDVRVMEPDVESTYLIEVHRPDGVVFTTLVGRRFPLEGAVDAFPARVNEEKARAEAQGDAPRLKQLEQRERDYLLRVLQPIESQLKYRLPVRAERLCERLRTVVDHASPTAWRALEQELLGRAQPLLLIMTPDGGATAEVNFPGIGPSLRVFADQTMLWLAANDLRMAEGSYRIAGMPVREVFRWAAERNLSLALNVYMTVHTPTYVFWSPEDARLLAQGQFTSKVTRVKSLSGLQPGGQSDSTGGKRAMCSGCMQAFPADQLRVLPWYNEGLQAYVTTFRCPACFPQSLQETRDRFCSRWPEEVEVRSLALFFRNHAVFIHELLRGDRDDKALQVTLSILEMLEKGALRLPIVVEGKVVAPG